MMRASKPLCSAPAAVLLVELRGVLTREKFAKQLETRGLNAIEVFDGYAALTHIVVPAIIQQTIVNDPSDDAVLACALAA
jgi:predicted nucleic acid-binding protein